MKDLTVLEQIILSAIWSLKGEAYGVSVRHRAEKFMGKNINYGTLYNALEQLLGKGYVKKRAGDSGPDRIGRPRIYLALTPRGEKALRSSYELQRTIWDSIPDFIKSQKP